MKLFLLVLAICVTVAFGNQPQEIGDIHIGGANPEPSDGMVYAQTYDHDLLSNGWGWGVICDDFELADDIGIDTVVTWMAFVDHDMVAIPPTDYCDIAFSQDIGDDDPNTATAVWSGTAATTSVDTGDAFGSGTIPIYAVTCVLPSTVPLTAGVRYWLEITIYYEDNWRTFMCVFPIENYTQVWANNGAPPWETGYDLWGYEGDMFFELYGTPQALDNSTWGNIKSVF